MTRRDLLKQVARITGSAVVGGELFLTAGCTTGSKAVVDFKESDLELLDEVGETIIPADTTPGAKSVKIGEFMKLMVSDCYTETQQTAFIQGMLDLESACEKMHGRPFKFCDAAQRTELLTSLDKEASAVNKVRKVINKTVGLLENIGKDRDPSEAEGLPNHYFTMMKQLTLLGFFTSETGMTETLRHVPVPGKYDGELPYGQGEKAWAE